MFDSVALNVVIGLVFVYLLYSLLTTLLTEIVSTWLDLRGRTLEEAIYRMLTDGNSNENGKWIGSLIWPRTTGWLKRQFDRISGRGNAKKHTPNFGYLFLDSPSIKYLSQGTRGWWSLFSKNRPAYFSKEVFATTIVHLCREHAGSGYDKVIISKCLADTNFPVGPSTRAHLQNLFRDGNEELGPFLKNLEKWFDETMDRANGWFKSNQRWVSFGIGLLIAICLNIDSIRMAELLSRDSTARAQLVALSLAMNSDSAKAAAIARSGKGLNGGNPIVDSSYSLVDKDLKAARFALGLGWDFSKVDRPVSEEIEPGVEDNLLIDKVLALNDSIKKMEAFLDRVHPLDSVNITTLNKLSILRRERFDIITAINTRFTTSFLSIDGLKPVCCDGQHRSLLSGTDDGNFIQKVGLVAHTAWHSSTSVIGWILTALALSVGAPFWFDLLQRLVSLRGTGVKPEEKKVQSA